MDAAAALGLLDDEAIELDAAALRLAALDRPDVDLEPYLDLLGEIRDRLAEAGATAHRPPEQADALTMVLGIGLGFTGDRTTYDDPDNAEGGGGCRSACRSSTSPPRGGWAGRPRCSTHPATSSSGWARLPSRCCSIRSTTARPSAPKALARLLSAALGGGGAPSSEHLAPMSNRAVLVRLLLNQATRAESAGRLARALTLFERITAVAPDNAHGWWERAGLQLVARDVPGARSSLSAVLEVTREPGLRAHVVAALDALSGAG